MEQLPTITTNSSTQIKEELKACTCAIASLDEVYKLVINPSGEKIIFT